MVLRIASRSPARRTIFGFTALTVLLLLASGLAAATSAPGAHPAAHAPVASVGAGHALPPPGSARSPASGTHPTAASTLPNVPISAVIGSLESGAGPAYGSHLTCTTTGPSTAGCFPIHPAVYGPITWNNESPLLANPASHPAAGIEAGLAFDFADNLYLFFGGCLVTACPSGETWGYQYGTWTNYTALLPTSPSPRYAPAMDYDADWGGVVLFGGCDPYGLCPMGDTWGFTLSSGWVNVTSDPCNGACPTPVWGASLAWDSYEGVSVLIDGCGDAYCSFVVNQTFLLGPPGTFWEVAATGGYGPLPRAFASLAWDGTNALSLVLFGGTYPCATGYCNYNDTWLYDAFYGYSEADTSSFLVGASPPGVGGAAFSYDNATSEMILAGGYNDSSGTISTQTWSFGCSVTTCSWTNITSSSPSPDRAFMASAENNSGYAPWFVGGENNLGTYLGDQWAIGVAPTSVVAAGDPNPTEIDATTWINDTVVGGTAPYLQTVYLPAYAGLYTGLPLDVAYYFGLFGSYQFNITVIDSYGLLAATTETEIVNPHPSVSITANPLADVNGTTPFAATVTAHTGVGPFTYNWSWGDGSPIGHGASATHVFTAKGNYTVTVNVTDRFGYSNTSTINITVSSGPSVELTATPMATDAAMNVTFTATGSSGQGPYTYAWSFGDGSTGAGASVKHAYAAGGQYKVNVTVTDSVGGSAKSSVTVTVAQPLTATVTASPAAPTTSTLVTFTATASGGTGADTYAWSFGDGSAGATTATATHTYATKGTYTATVVITDSLGAKVTKSVSVTVASPTSSGSTSGTGGLSGLDIALIVVVLVVIAGVAAMLMMRRRKPTATGPMASPPMGATGGSPPPSGPGSPPPQ